MANPAAPDGFSIARIPGNDPAQEAAHSPVKTKAAQLAKPNNLIYGLAIGAFALLSLAYSAYQSRRGTHMKAFIGDLGALASVLGVALIYLRNQDKEKLIDQERGVFIAAKDPWKTSLATNNAKLASQEEPFTKILNGIYLGNAAGFATTTHLTCNQVNQQVSTQINSANGGGFKHVITLCPIADLQKGFLYSQAGAQGLTALLCQSFASWKINWFNLGENVAATDAGWDHLVFNCTRANSQAAPQMDAIGVKDRFESIFKVLDRGAIGHERVLIHSDNGSSFCAEVLIAYLVNRYSITVDQALAYLRSKRLCVNPVHYKQLQAYERSLANS